MSKKFPKIRLFDIENWREISATLMRNKTRTFLTGFGIFWGVFMLALLVGGAKGAKDMLLRNFSGFSTNSAVLSSGTTSIPYKGYAKNRSYDLDLTDIDRLKVGLPELSTVTGTQYWGNVKLSNGRYSVAGQTMGCMPEYANVMQPYIYKGRFINQNDIVTGRKVCVIGKRIAEQIFPGVEDPVGRQMNINGISCLIVGMAGQMSEISFGAKIDEQVIMPFPTFRKIFGRGDDLDIIMLVAKPNQSLPDLKNRITRIIYSRHCIHPDDQSAMWFMDISSEFSKVDTLFLGVSLLAAFIGFSSLVAGIIGIGNIMWVIVRERTQEIGIRRALGAKPLDIITQILSEGMVLTAVAGTAGLLFAAAILAVMQHVTANEVSVPQFQLMARQAVWIMVTFLVLGSCAGLIPAVKAMRIKPVEALNSK